jgi:hypothetical protein
MTCAVCGIGIVKGPRWEDQVMFDFTDPLCLLCFFWAVRAVEDSLTKTQKTQVNLPRTVVFYGIKVGMQKQKGKIEWEDDEVVVARLERFYPDTWKDFVQEIYKPLKSQLETLSAGDLKKLGVTVVEADDKVIIKPTDSEVDKLVEALLRDEIKEAA